eukprot:scaffold8641_cov134-Isochrysis_galbana.AAC.17
MRAPRSVAAAAGREPPPEQRIRGKQPSSRGLSPLEHRAEAAGWLCAGWAEGRLPFAGDGCGVGDLLQRTGWNEPHAALTTRSLGRLPAGGWPLGGERTHEGSALAAGSGVEHESYGTAKGMVALTGLRDHISRGSVSCADTSAAPLPGGRPRVPRSANGARHASHV